MLTSHTLTVQLPQPSEQSGCLAEEVFANTRSNHLHPHKYCQRAADKQTRLLTPNRAELPAGRGAGDPAGSSGTQQQSSPGPAGWGEPQGAGKVRGGEERPSLSQQDPPAPSRRVMKSHRGKLLGTEPGAGLRSTPCAQGRALGANTTPCPASCPSPQPQSRSTPGTAHADLIPAPYQGHPMAQTSCKAPLDFTHPALGCQNTELRGLGMWQRHSKGYLQESTKRCLSQHHAGAEITQTWETASDGELGGVKSVW